MSDDTPGFFRNLAGYATARLSYAKDRWLADRPKTFYSAGAQSQYQWQGQAVDRDELKQVKQIRETGGMVAQLYHAKALIRFGTGAELQADDDALQTTLNDDLFPGLDNLVLDLGEDAIWYPYALAEPIETNGNGFSHYECVEPWTTIPRTDPHGDIVAWEHEVSREHSATFTPDELRHITINKSSGRDTVGISDVLRSQDEIEQYKNNQRAINHAIELAGFPHNVWKVGAEGKAPVSDNELRRVRNIVEDPSGDTQWVMGADIDIDQIEPGQFDFQAITERDLRMLTGAIGLPFELVGYGSDGLGSGHEADLKMKLLAIQNEADRRRFADQFIKRFVNPVVAEYTPFSAENVDIRLQFEPFLEDKSDLAEWIEQVGDYMRNEDVVSRLGLPPIEDDELAQSFRPPRQVEEAEEGDPGADAGPFGGMFEDAVDSALSKHLADADLPEWEATYLAMYDHALWHDDTDRALAGFSESALPAMVEQRMREAILDGSLFSEFDTVPSDKLAELRATFADKLSEDGWTLNELTDAIQDLEPSLEEYEAERIARTETQHTVSMARKEAYEDRDLADDQFKWVGPDDHRNAEFDGVEICRRIARETDPALGGTPRSLEELDELIEDTHDELGVETSYREFTPHINCRHTYVRHVS